MYINIAAKSLCKVSTDVQNPASEATRRATASEKKKGEEKGCSKCLYFVVISDFGFTSD